MKPALLVAIDHGRAVGDGEHVLMPPDPTAALHQGFVDLKAL